MLSRTALVCYILSFLSLVSFVQATTYVTTNASFTDFTTACYSALAVDLNCNTGISQLRKGLYYPENVLTSVCTSDCSNALAGYEASVIAACNGETYDSLTDTGDVPMYTIPQMLRYLYNYTCLTDSGTGEFCNVLAANVIGIADDQSNLNTIDNGGSLNCTDCGLKQYQFLAGSAFYHDDDTVSAYSSLTSSCSATGYPLITSTLGFNATVTATATTTSLSPTCTGTTYSVQSSDTCESVSKGQGVGTFWLLLDNDLPAYCANFPANGTLCIQHQCTTYTVQANDTCTSIASAKSINYAQILAWNPQFGLTCGNINNTIGLEICITSPGPSYTAPPPLTAITTGGAAISTLPVPTNVASGTTTSCGLWYEAMPGDYCNLIILNFGISLNDFLILNPEVYSNCTNLYAYESYCMEPVGDISDYPGALGYISSVAWVTTPASLIPTATYIPALYVSPDNGTLANGTRTDCANYFYGEDFQIDLTNTSYVSNCDLALTLFGITFVELTTWNPSLAVYRLDNCTLNLGLKYCAQWSDSPVTSTVTSYPTALPTGVGSVADCTQYTFVDGGLGCNDIIQDWNITLEYFISMNPEIGTDCSGLQNLTYYCVNTTAAVSSVSIPPVSKTSTIVTPPAPTMSGIPSNCDRYYVIQNNDDCSTVEAAFGITAAEFLAWNPTVSSDCETNFWVGEAYCVGVSGSGSSGTITTTSTSVGPQTTKTSITPPGPTMSGTAADCDLYHVVITGDSCDSLEEEYGITAAEFFAWNPAVSTDCETNFWPAEAYCVGVSGSSNNSSSTTSTTVNPTTTTALATPPGPTMSGIPSNCNAYYVIATDDTCPSVEAKFGITDAEFHDWNPTVSSDCTTNFWLGEAYCVGVSS